MADGTVKIYVDTNAKSAVSSFKTLNTSLGKTKTTATGATTATATLTRAVKGLALAYGAVKIKDFTKSIISASSAYEETANKFNIVFATIREQATETADLLATVYGLSNEESQRLLSNTGDLLTGFGFAQQGALDLSTSLNKLAIDLASLNNVEITRASQALTSALTGEREALKSLGIVITEDMVKAQSALIKSSGDYKDASEQELKAIATLQLAYKQSPNAVGDAIRSQESYANQTKRLAGNIFNLKKALGDELLPVFTEYTVAVNDYLKEEGDGLAENFRDILNGINAIAQSFDALASYISGAGKIMGATLGAISGVFTGLPDNLKTLDTVYKDVFDNIKQETVQAGQAIKKLGDIQEETVRKLEKSPLKATTKAPTIPEDNEIEEVKTSWDMFKDAFKGDAKTMGDSIEDKIGGAFSDVITSADASFKTLGQSVLSIFADVASSLVSSGISGALKSVDWGSMFGGTASANGNVFANGNVQAFANGGAFTNSVVSKPTIFPMANGGTGLMGEAGAEAVMPLTRKNGKLGVEASGSGSNVNIYNQTDTQIQTVKRPNNDIDLFIKRVRDTVSSEGSKGAMATAIGRQQSSGLQGA